MDNAKLVLPYFIASLTSATIAAITSELVKCTSTAVSCTSLTLIRNFLCYRNSAVLLVEFTSTA